MCLSCGCGKPNDNHGDQRNITLDDLDQAGQASGTTRDQVVQNIASGVQSGNSPNGNMNNNTMQQGQDRGQTAGFAQSPDPQQLDNAQIPNAENNYGQVHGRPGTYEPSPGREAGTTAWSNEQQDVNYQLPGQQSSQSQSQ
jgi:hypothetical protein